MVAELGVVLLICGLLVAFLCTVMICDTWDRNNKRKIAEDVKRREKNDMLEYIRAEIENAVLQHEVYLHADNIDKNNN